MLAKFRFLAIFSLFLAIPLAISASAWAEDLDNCRDERAVGENENSNPLVVDPSKMGAEQLTYANADARNAQNQTRIEMAAQALVAPIDVATNNCIEKLKELFGTLQDLVSANGISITQGIVNAIVGRLVAAITATISSSCNSFVAAATSTIAGAQSKFNFCMPLPNFDFGAATFDSPLKQTPCNGARLITYPNSQTPNATGLSPRNSLWNW